MFRFIFAYCLVSVGGFVQMTFAQPAYYQTNQTLTDSSTFQSLPTPLPKANTFLKIGSTLPLLRQSSFTGYYAMLGLEAVVEQKIVGGLTVVGGLETNFGLTLDGRGAKYFSLEVPIALRYYFSLTHREKQRPDRHSFFSPYVAIQTYNVLYSNLIYSPEGSLSDLQRYKRKKLESTITNSGSVGDQFIWLDYAVVQLGTQHRILNKYYLDINVLIPVGALAYSKGDWTLAMPPLINVKFGVGYWRKYAMP
ncbi:hypothetical protein [Larkinella rosea]|uniref:Outer membrane protein beta-barrel domain-containing protein n=1 Tax=Larkinella rosea TaxID=2025312 RepID=A0A3P1BYY3_9BACT|nr:hypothetical protein [Larkinella rosea]RRB06311.1 hypothetical protein EHT25_00455 [Larkinella rosea]